MIPFRLDFFFGRKEYWQDMKVQWNSTSWREDYLGYNGSRRIHFPSPYYPCSVRCTLPHSHFCRVSLRLQLDAAEHREQRSQPSNPRHVTAENYAASAAAIRGPGRGHAPSGSHDREEWRVPQEGLLQAESENTRWTPGGISSSYLKKHNHPARVFFLTVAERTARNGWFAVVLAIPRPVTLGADFFM